MANFTPSNLVKAQALLQKRFTEAEMRQKTLPALRLALMNQDVLLPSAEKLRTREDRSVEAYIMNRQKRATSNSRTYNHTGANGDSTAIALSWKTYTDVFHISLKAMDNNMFSFDAALAQHIENCILNIQSDIETDNISYLLAQRSHVNAGGGFGTVNGANFTYEVPGDYKNRFAGMAKAMMFQNNYRGMYDMITDSLTGVDANFYQNQGAGNQTNTGFQYANLNIAQSNDLSDNNYPAGVALVMPAGSFANLPWISKENRNGWGDYNTYTGGFGSMADPYGLPLTYAIHGYALRADTSGTNGNSQDVTLEFEISVDIAQVLSPLSTTAGTSESVVFEVAQLA